MPEGQSCFFYQTGPDILLPVKPSDIRPTSITGRDNIQPGEVKVFIVPFGKLKALRQLTVHPTQIGSKIILHFLAKGETVSEFIRHFVHFRLCIVQLGPFGHFFLVRAGLMEQFV